MRKIGYARTSTADQRFGLQAQVEELERAGCDIIFSEHVSSLDERPEFEKAIATAKAGDTIIFTKLDRFARSLVDLWTRIEHLEAKGVSIRSLDMSFDSQSPTGRLIISIVAAISEWEISVMRERQRAGIERARAAGKYKGRPSISSAKVERIRELHREGMRPGLIAEEVKVSPASVYRYRSA